MVTKRNETAARAAHSLRINGRSRRLGALACAGLLAFSAAACGREPSGVGNPAPTGSADASPTSPAAVSETPGKPSEAADPSAEPGAPFAEPTGTEPTAAASAPTPLPTPSPAPTPAVYGSPGELSAYNAEQSNYTLNVDASSSVHDISDLLLSLIHI